METWKGSCQKISLKKFVILQISNIQQMSKFLSFWLILCSLLYLTTTSNLLLDPPFPPSAFLNQKYSIRFQVYGLIKPTFSFSGLPSFLVGYSNGSLIGIPQAIGAFRVNVTYSDKTRKGNDEVIICVQSNITDNTNLDAYEASNKGNLYIDSSSNQWIYKAGDQIQIGFNFINVVEPVVASYKNLPKGLVGDNATVSGQISDIGVYTFSLTIADSNGYRDQAYFTINIQPNQSKASYNSRLNSIVDVPIKNVQYSINLNLMQLTLSTTKTASKNAFSKLIDATNNLTIMKNALYSSESVLTLAQQSQTSVQQSYQNTQQTMNSLQNYLNGVSSAIAASKMQISLIKTALSQYNASLKQAKQRMKIAEETLLNSSLALNKSASTKQKILKQSDAQTTVSVASANAISARNAFNQSSVNLQIMKDNVNRAQRQLDNAKILIQNTQLDVELANSDNDVATTNLKLANANIKIAADNIQSIGSYIEKGKPELQKAKTALGVSKFNLVLAQNRLYIAQARKGAADKALAIIVSQGNRELSYSDDYEFKGCDNYAYPSMFGSVHITQFINNGVKTTSGHILIWGDCTQKSVFKVGDLIYYQGSLVKDYISVRLIKKLSK